jgi:hypothetical protein
MGRFSWDVEEALNITEILTGLGHKVEDRLPPPVQRFFARRT